MAGWHHRLVGREFEWTPGVGVGHWGLACCSSWGRKESNTTERLNWTELNIYWGLGTSKFIVYVLSLLNEEIYIKDLCVCVCVHVLRCSVMSGSVILWTVAHQAPLSMGFLRQEYWSWVPFLSPGDLPLCMLLGKLINLSVFQSPVIWRLIYPPHNIFVRIKWKKIKTHRMYIKP